MKKVYLLIFLAILCVFFIFVSSNSKNTNSIPTIKLVEKTSAEELAERLIKEVYRGVHFEKQDGNGKNFLIRYYCSNLCIDVCENGRIKYISDIKAHSSKDIFYEWLFEDEKAKTIQETEDGGIVYKAFEGKNIYGTIGINSENGRIFIARINIKCSNE